VESDIRFYRRRASEELAAASRAVTEAARERRMLLAGAFLERLKGLERSEVMGLGLAVPEGATVFNWVEGP